MPTIALDRMRPSVLAGDLWNNRAGDVLASDDSLHKSAHPLNMRPSLEQFRSDAKWYDQHKSELVRKYRGKRIAILNGVVVDSADDLPTLAKRIRDKYGKTPVFMPLVTEEPRVVRIASRPIIADKM